jgi:UDP-N-acetylglucosamine 2-epimerase
MLTGDVMYDAALTYRQLAENRVWPSALIEPDPGFALATVQRAENTDDLACLGGIISALERIAAGLCPVLWPVHPRTRKRIEETGLAISFITIIEPVSYLDMLLLEGRARFILTDSGGVQKEAYFLKVPCIAARRDRVDRDAREPLQCSYRLFRGANPGSSIDGRKMRSLEVQLRRR